MMTRYEREVIAKYDRYKSQWWLLSPKELRDLEKEVKKILFKNSVEVKNHS